MDRALNALVNLDVPGDVVRIDVRGSLNQDSRHELAHIIRRIRRMGIRSHVRVDLSQAVLVESSALASLRSDLNAIDAGTLPGIYGNGVSLDLTLAAGELADGFPLVPAASLEAFCGRPLEEYSDAELLTASDSIFALLDSPRAVAGSDLLGRYNDIGEELRRRRQEPLAPLPASEGQAAS